jgi:hypothetical protein
MTEEERHEVCTKVPRELWTPKQENDIYWWFYHEMEDPTEEQIVYFCKKIPSKRWFMFLLEKFPSEKNYQEVVRCKSHVQMMKKILNQFLHAELTGRVKLDEVVFKLMLAHGGKKASPRARLVLQSI